jgi:ABC-2 type transport system permease protein
VVIGFSFAYWVNLFLARNIREVTVFYAMTNGFFFWFMLLVQIPVITMRIFSEEFKLGTIEMLLTAPVREWEVVLAKYFAAMAFFTLLWSPMLFDIAWLHWVSTEKISISIGMMILPFACLLLLGALYISIGIFASVLTQNQIVAAIISFSAIFLVFCIGFIAQLNPGSQGQGMIEYFSALSQMETFSRGILDTRAVVYYLSGSAFFLFLTQRILLSRRLKA